MILSASDLKDVIENGEHPGPPADERYRQACVFLLLSVTDDPYFLAIQKSDTEGYPWRGQMALPGGHVDAEDPTVEDAVFRELEEELNLPRETVEMVGSMGHFQTINCRNIEAFVGLWNGDGVIDFDRGEISRVFEIPLAALLRVHYDSSFNGCIPDISELVYPYRDVAIWGATARILHHFIELVAPRVAWAGAEAAPGILN